jgi:zinc protease
VAAQILATGASSRLHNVLRERVGGTYGVQGAVYDYQNWSYWNCSTNVRSEDAPEFYSYLRATIADMGQTPVTAEELSGAKASLTGSVAYYEDQPEYEATLISQAAMERASPEYWQRYFAQIQEVTAADVIRVAQRYLADDRLIVVAIGPRRCLDPALSSFGKITVLDDRGRPTAR